MNKRVLYTFFIFIIISLSFLVARSFRVSKIPHGNENACANCHVNPGGGGARTPFGEAVNSLVTPGGQENFWSPSLAAVDSDGDGYTNGQELQDPDGTWQPGQAAPGDPALVSNPGDPNSIPAVTFVEFNDGIPNDYALMNNYPNPFNPSTNIEFALPEPGNVRLEIYNTLGQLVRVLADAQYSAGLHTLVWNGKDDSGNSVGSGIYLYRMISNNFAKAKQMVLAK